MTDLVSALRLSKLNGLKVVTRLTWRWRPDIDEGFDYNEWLDRMVEKLITGIERLPGGAA